MTDFVRIKNYYSTFDEQHRLDEAEGKLEYEISLKLLLKYIPQGSHILDLGGGAGKYSIELAKRGYPITLADLSEQLLSQAQKEISQNLIPNIESIDCVNAVDLSVYPTNHFDTVILFGPLYHLLGEKERERCIAEVARVLKPEGLIFASFIPYVSGTFGIVDRLFYAPNQVSPKGLLHTFETGEFQNSTDIGFQEGYYPRCAEIESLFDRHGFDKIIIRSIRSFGYGREENLLALKQTDKSLYGTLLNLIDSTASEPSVVETCGHALYFGKLKK